MRVLGIDPGGTTGYAILDWTSGTVVFGDVQKWDGLETLIGKGDIVVVETFRLYPGMGKRLVWNDMIAAQVYGVVLYLAEHAGATLIPENAATGKKIQLSKSAGGNDHSRDALRHALSYVLRAGIPLFPEAQTCLGGTNGINTRSPEDGKGIAAVSRRNRRVVGGDGTGNAGQHGFGDPEGPESAGRQV